MVLCFPFDFVFIHIVQSCFRDFCFVFQFESYTFSQQPSEVPQVRGMSPLLMRKPRAGEHFPRVTWWLCSPAGQGLLIPGPPHLWESAIFLPASSGGLTCVPCLELKLLLAPTWWHKELMEKETREHLQGLGLGVLPGEFSWLLAGHPRLFPLRACATLSVALSIEKVHIYVLLLKVKPSKAAWALFMFITSCLFHILSILVGIV